MSDGKRNYELEQQQHTDMLARKLSQIQREVTGLEDSPALPDSSSNDIEFENSRVAGQTETKNGREIGDDPECVENIDLNVRLASAKKVMGLLEKMRPQSASDLNDTAKRQDTRRSGTAEGDGKRLVDLVEIDEVEINEIPTTIGRFEVLKMLGQGGFGLVFLARDPHLDRLIALKIPTFNSLLKSDAQIRFQQEGRVVASLSHPNIVPVFEVGSEGPISFIASEYVAGTDLANWVSRHGPLDPKLAASTVAIVADAVQHAHSRNVIHRDLKPSNILLESGEDGPEFDPSSVRIADFGLARFLAESDDSFTRTGSVIGTPAFSAPEQLQSNAGIRPSESADIYSIGAMLYFLLTGKTPFHGGSIVEMVRNVQTVIPASPNKTDPNVPADLSAICLKCLEKSPRARYSSAHSLRQDLQRFIDGEPVLARPITASRRAWKWCARNPAIATLATVALVAVVGGSIASLWSAANARNAAQASRQQYLESKKTIDEYYVRVSQSPMFLSARYKDVKIGLLESARAHYEKFLTENADDPDLRVDIIRTNYRIAESWKEAGEFDQARPGFLATLQLTENATAKNPESRELRVLRAMSLASLGTMDQDEGKNERAFNQVQAAIEIFELLQTETPVDQNLASETVRTYQTMVHYYRQKHDPAMANSYSLKQQSLLDAVEDQAALDSKLQCYYAISLGDQSLVARDQNDNIRSLELLDKSIAILECLIESEPNPDWFAEIVAGGYYRRALHYVYAGQNEMGYANAAQARQTLDSLALGNHAPGFVGFRIGVMNLEATCLQNLGRRADGNKILSEALLAQRELARNHPDLVQTKVSLVTMIGNNANNAVQDMRLDDAQDLVDELIELLDQYDSDGLVHLGLSRSRVTNHILSGQILNRHNDFSGAVEQFNLGHDLVLELLADSPDNPGLVGSLENIYDCRANSFVQLGEFEPAISDRRQALAIGRGNPSYNQLALAECLARAGQVSGSRSVLAEFAAGSDTSGSNIPNFSMTLAFIHGAIACELQKQNEEDVGDVSDPGAEIKAELTQATALFLRAVDNGYFAGKPQRILNLESRPHLRSLFEINEVNQIIAKQRRILGNIK